jgi:hypothetical protein
MAGLSNRSWLLAWCPALLLAPWIGLAAGPPAASDEPPDDETPWPYQIKQGDTVITVYQPQLDAWDGVKLKARAAVAVLTDPEKGATGPGGAVVAGRGGTAGNVYTGNEVSGGRGVVYDPNTGNATQIGGIKGENGGAMRVGDDVYAGHDGNVYKRTDGGWEQVTRPPTAEPRSTTRPSTYDSRSLNQERDARDLGAQRSSMSRGATGSMHRSFGGGRRR